MARRGRLRRALDWLVRRPGRVVSRLCLVASLVFLVLLLIPLVGTLVLLEDGRGDSYGPYRGAVVSRSQYFIRHSADDLNMPRPDFRTDWPGEFHGRIALAYHVPGGVDVWEGSSLLASYPEVGTDLKYYGGVLALLDLAVDPEAKLLYVLDNRGPQVGVYALKERWDRPLLVKSYELPEECTRVRGMYLSEDGKSLTFVDTASLTHLPEYPPAHRQGDAIGCRVDSATGALDSVIRWSHPASSVIRASAYDPLTRNVFFVSSTDDSPRRNFLSVLRPDATTVEDYVVPDDPANQCPCWNGPASLAISDSGAIVYAVLGQGVYRFGAADSTATPTRVWGPKDDGWRPVGLVLSRNSDGDARWWVVERNAADHPLHRFTYLSGDFSPLIHPIEARTFETIFLPLPHGLVVGEASACWACRTSAASGFYDSDTVIDLAVSRPFDSLMSWPYFWLSVALLGVSQVVFRATSRHERARSDGNSASGSPS